MAEKETLLQEYKYDKSMRVVQLMSEELNISLKKAIRLLQEIDYDHDHPKKRNKGQVKRDK